MFSIRDPSDKVFFENAHIRHPCHYHELFLRSRPYKGEPPTVTVKTSRIWGNATDGVSALLQSISLDFNRLFYYIFGN